VPVGKPVAAAILVLGADDGAQDGDFMETNDPRNAAYHRMRGKLRRVQGDFDGALALFK